jgi:hypothetical protein
MKSADNDLFNMIFPLFLFFPSLLVQIDNCIDNYFLGLYPTGHFAPVTILLLPFFRQTIFFDTDPFAVVTIGPVTVIDWVADAGERVALPAWSASTWQVPGARRLSELPVTEHVIGESDLKVTTPPLVAVALREIDLVARVTFAGGPKDMDWAVRVISKVSGYISEAAYVSVAGDE